VKWGVAVARKGGVPKDRVLNAMSLAQIIASLSNVAQAHRQEIRFRQPLAIW
jgi:hypothetical protein